MLRFRLSLYFLFSCLLLLASKSGGTELSEAEKNTLVIELSANNFNRELGVDKDFLIVFYAPW
jgi:hypothetical protein